MAGFFFSGDEIQTPKSIESKRKLIEMLSRDAYSSAPVQHWTQGLARVMTGAANGYEEAGLKEQEKKGLAEGNKALLAALGMGDSGAPQSTGPISPSISSQPSAVSAQPPAPASNAVETNPLPPPMAAADVPLSNRQTMAGASPVIPSGSFAPQAGSVSQRSPELIRALGSGQPVNVPPGAPPGTPRMAMNPTGAATPAAAAIIKGFEGYRSSPYWDVNALRTGYGSDTVTKPDGSVTSVAQGTQINRDDAERDLQRRISTEFMPKAASAVGAERWAMLPPNAQAALTSVAYNYGSLPRSVAAAAQTGDVNAIAQAVEGLSGHNGGINAERRQKEAAIIRGGAPVQMAQATQNDAPSPDAAQAQFNVPGAQVGKPSTAALLAALSNPWAQQNPALMGVAQKVLGDQLSGNQFGFQVVGDQLYRTSPKTGDVQLVPGPKSGNWSIIKDNNGNPVARMEAKTGEIVPLIQGAGGLPEGGPKTSDIAELRKEVLQLPSYKNLAQAAPIYQSMYKTAGTNSKASDLNLVYGLGKIMDPGSVVREGEMIMVKNTASLPDWLVGAANSLNGGQQLTPETRAAILKEAHNRVTSYQEQFNNDSAHYQGIAGRNKMRTEDVIPSFGEFKPWEAPKPVSQGATPSMQPSPLSPTPQQQVKPPVRVNTPEEARKLTKGTPFIIPDGRQGVAQ